MKIPEKETKKTAPVQWKHEEKRPQGSGDGVSSQRKEETVIIFNTTATLFVAWLQRVSM